MIQRSCMSGLKVIRKSECACVCLFVFVCVSLFVCVMSFVFGYCSEFGEDDPDLLKDSIKRFMYSCAGYTVASYVLVSDIYLKIIDVNSIIYRV